jgi:hypothetical protein
MYYSIRSLIEGIGTVLGADDQRDHRRQKVPVMILLIYNK